VANHFRAEIAGLRALAVIAVILFHLKIDGFQGGFVGVDIFFVISGYLITRNILRDLQTGRFSFGQFYIRRARRILPALIFTVVATYLLGALWCSPEMFLDLAKECTHALLSISNVQYWRESHRYFAPNSDELALLHCWSLSLEEQFYLFWPALIVLAGKTGRTFEVIAAAALVSLLLSTLYSAADPLAAFFLMPFRIFEFGIGALVIAVETKSSPGKILAEIVSGAGILCIAACVFVFRPDMPHLELANLVPCLGAASIILAGSKPRIARLVTNPAMVFVGAISYSLYLCHWPVIFFARFIFGDDANTPIGIGLEIVLMMAIAIAMYRLIEKKFIVAPQQQELIPFKKNALAFWSTILLLSALTHATFMSKGFAWRVPQAQAELAHLQGYPSGSDVQPVTGAIGFMLVGDSQAIQYMAGLSSIMKPLNIGFEILGGPGCPIMSDVTLKDRRQAECIAKRDETLARLSETSLPVIYSQAWDIYTDATTNFEFDAATGLPPTVQSHDKLQIAVERTFEKILTNGRRILIIGDQVKTSCQINRARLLQGPLPHAAEPPCPSIDHELAEQSTAPFNRMLARIQSRWPNQIQLLRPVDYFCDAQCPVIKDGLWLYFDRTHFSVVGSNYMAGKASNLFRNFVSNEPHS
jgi:peptidoglycan/LPS O-acetylase OafA/YrhL